MNEADNAKEPEPAVESPPPAPRPSAEDEDPRTRLHQLAHHLRRSADRRLWMEYLRLRRAVR